MQWGARVYRWFDHRLGISAVILPIVEHPVPRDIDWWYVFGGATLTAFVFQVITGVALAMSYVPAPNSAYQSLDFITNHAVLGSVVRGIHYYGSSAMVIMIGIHLAHEYLAGSFKFPREMNWLTGVLLLFLTLGMAFTGQLLRWDQDAYWAVVVAAEQAGRTPIFGNLVVQLVIAGQTVGGPTLTRFYATHVFLIPAAMFLFIGTHLYLIIRHGISEPPKVGEPVDPATYEQRYHQIIERGVPFFPDAAWKDVVFALIIGVGVMFLAIVVGPPHLGKLADPTVVQADPRPDWYFLWYFALLALIPPSIENGFILGFPLAAALTLVLLPFLSNRGERHPARRPWAVLVVGITVISIAILVEVGNAEPWSPNFSPAPIPASAVGALSPTELRGEAIFEQDGCHQCHLVAGTGGQRGPDLTHVGGRLTQAQLVTRVLNGGTNMPAYAGHLSTSDLNDLVEFLQKLK